MFERRKHPRLHKILPLRISHTSGDIVTQTKNISPCGAYFSSEEPLSLMTKLQITLLLPEETESKSTYKQIKCRGVVVRADREKKGYSFAVFFNEISDRERHKLESYIQNHLDDHN